MLLVQTSCRVARIHDEGSMVNDGSPIIRRVVGHGEGCAGASRPGAGPVVLATTPVHVKMRGSDTVNDFLALATIVYEQRDGRWLIVHQHVSQPPR